MSFEDYIDEEFTFTDKQLTEYFEQIKDTVMSHVKPYRQPHQGATTLNHVTSRFNLKVDTYTDGTTTEVLLSLPKSDGWSGRGVSRRRKGDPRNFAVGEDLALARALRSLADTLEKEVAGG